jgi:hypothetical protein
MKILSKTAIALSVLVFIGSLSNVNGGPERFMSGGTTGPVPEPATMVLFGTSLVGLAGAVRRRRKAAAALKAASDADVS